LARLLDERPPLERLVLEREVLERDAVERDPLEREALARDPDARDEPDGRDEPDAREEPDARDAVERLVVREPLRDVPEPERALFAVERAESVAFASAWRSLS
jgi:hypothetical protein